MRLVLLMALFRLSSARSLRNSLGGRTLAFLGTNPVSFRHISSPPPNLAMRANKEAADEAAARKAVESSIDMKARLGVGKAKNVGQRGPSLYTLGEGAKSGLPPGCGAGLAPPLFTVLGIETSCDDTGAAVVRSDGCVLGEALASQHTIHAKFGGVVPGLAKDAHEQNIDAVIGTALAQVPCSWSLCRYFSQAALSIPVEENVTDSIARGLFPSFFSAFWLLSWAPNYVCFTGGAAAV